MGSGAPLLSFVPLLSLGPHKHQLLRRSFTLLTRNTTHTHTHTHTHTQCVARWRVAQDTWDWLQSVRMMASNGLLVDGLNASCAPSGAFWTYNQVREKEPASVIGAYCIRHSHVKRHALKFVCREFSSGSQSRCISARASTASSRPHRWEKVPPKPIS
jgi:hypothetical protein